MGGYCKVCNLLDDDCVYDFHHKNPVEKDFKISGKHKFDDIVDELDKCVLLCCLCHRKLHAGFIDPLTF